MFLKPQDVVLVLSIVKHAEKRTYAERAKYLHMSASEVHAGITRLVTARLLDPERKQVRKGPLLEFIIHGVPYAYATAPGEFTRGIPTAWAAPILINEFSADKQNLPIWSHPEGKIQGLAIEPLYRNVPALSLKDNEIYPLLALVDALRIGRVREKKIA